MKLKILVLSGIVPIALILFYYASITAKTKGSIVYTDHLSEVVCKVDDTELTLSDLNFYVLFQECKIEEQARTYNPDSPKDYWNAHTNGEFVQESAKKAVIEMAIHDYIMYELAKEAHVVLSTEEKEALEKARTKFWSSLFDEQLERLPLDYEEGNRIMKEIALIEAYEHRLAAENDEITFEGLHWDGYDYKKIKEEHKVKIHDKLWRRVALGDISLVHENVSYINGMTDEEREAFQNREKTYRLHLGK